MLTKLFPSYVAFSHGALLSDKGLLKLYPMPFQLKEATIARKLEFLSGRFHTKQALTALGDIRATETIPIHKNRSPIWPHGVTGSISHTHIYAGAAVVKTKDAQGIGFDIEHVFSKDLKEKIKYLICSPNEWDSIQISEKIDDCLKLTLIYSAKEAIYKCLSPITNVFIDFQDVSITELNLISSTFSARLNSPFSLRIESKTVPEGSFAINNDTVYCGLLYPPLTFSSLDEI